LTTKELALASRQRNISHFLLHQGSFDQKQHDSCPPPPYFSLFPRLKLKLKGCHFDTIEVIDAESQAVPNTLTDRNFQDALKKAETLGTVRTRGRELLLG
jgi:hypothetical protein